MCWLLGIHFLYHEFVQFIHHSQNTGWTNSPASTSTPNINLTNFSNKHIDAPACTTLNIHAHQNKKYLNEKHGKADKQNGKIIYLEKMKKHSQSLILLYPAMWSSLPLHFENQYSFERYGGEAVAMVVHYFQVVL